MIRFAKSPDVLVLRRGAGLLLQHRPSGRTLALGGPEAGVWNEWPGDSGAGDAARVFGKLAAAGFALPAGRPASPAASTFDSVRPRIAGRHARSHFETPDLAVLFNSARMAEPNPLLALGPYGALCWRGVAAGWPVAHIRREALRVFGTDEVLPFLGRLSRLGFIETGTRIPDGDCSVTKEFPAPEVQFQLGQSAVPWYCLWEICTTCDLRCRVCYLPHFRDRGPSEADATDTARQIIHAGVFYVCLLGGETLLRRDLERRIAELRDAGLYVKIITNGQRLTTRKALSLSAAGINQVEVSFDGLSPTTHEQSRGTGTFALALDAIRNCHGAGIPRSGVVLTMHSGNLHEMDQLPAFLGRTGVRECYLSPFKKSGLNGSAAPWEPPTADELYRVRKQIAGWNQTHPHLSVVLLPSCSCGRTSIVIGSNGDARLCSFSYSSIGNVREQQVLSLWKAVERQTEEAGPLGYCTLAKRAA